MKSKLLSFFSVLIIVTCSLFFLESCRRTTAEQVKSITVDPAFREFVDGFTAGPVSSDSDIIVRLNFDAADSLMILQPADPALFSFKPAIKGTAYWKDSRTIQFQPSEKLPSNTYYEASFKLSKLIQVPDSLNTLVFGFHTIGQDFEIALESSRAYTVQDLSKERLTGYILTADTETKENVSGIVTAQQNGRNLPVSWSQDAGKRKHMFTIDSITRGTKTSEVTILYNGKSIGVNKTGTLSYTIHGINEFAITDVETHRFPEEVIIVRFSDPLHETQELEGKIKLGKFFNYSYVINFHELYLYPASEIPEEEYLSISARLRNINGKDLGKEYSERIRFENVSPNVRFISDGTILPSTDGMIVPFEAVNLKAIDVRIIKIFQNNIPQFLQVNELSGNSQISRVGRTVLKKTISLGQVADFNRWNTYFLDISEFIKIEPGAIYTIEISFRPEFITIECNNLSSEQDNNVFGFYNEVMDENEENWEYSSDWYDDDYYYYDWYERDDPCSRSYYYGKKVVTNILATDIGLMAKSGEDGELFIFSTDLITADPIKDVNIKLLDFQLQTISELKTDQDGMCRLKTDNNPYLIIAEKDGKQSYLKLGDGNSLSLSSFDVSGEDVKKGLKGLLYGERGVWRPGDSLFVSFILEDQQNSLPKDHPVIFELYNPRGILIEKQSVTSGLNGFYAFHTATVQDAPTGIYRLIARVGKNTFNHNLRIESIKPNRLRIDIDPGEKFISKSDPGEIQINAQWLHGASAANLKVESDVTFQRTNTTFPKYPKFVFDDPAINFSSDLFPFFRGRLDENGKATITPDLKIENAPGIISANIETRVYEPGGEFSIDFISVNVSPFSSYVGILKPRTNEQLPYLFTERSYTFNIANVLESGKPISSGKVRIEVFKMEWRYWWSGYDNSASEFVYSMNSTPVTTKEIQIKNGLGIFPMNVPNEEWGKYYIRVHDPESGHTTGIVTFFDWYGYNRFAENDKTAAAMLTLSTNQRHYKTGEEIILNFNAPENSRAYVSIENGTGILETYQLQERNNQIEFKTRATAEMTPNVYISVILIQPHANTKSGLPIRLYGVVPVFVENPETKLKPVISAPEVMRPGKTSKVSISESSGRPMTYTLALVDEGLLNLTKFKTPDPHSRFYSREALGVKTWDMYKEVIGAWSGPVQRILSIGGGDDADIDPSGQRATRFKPMVKFIGPVELKKGKTNIHSIDIPEYVGSVKIMVVAGHDRAYGNAEKTTPVRNPLMLLGTLPRVIGPGETFRLPVTVFAMENHIKNVTVSLHTNNLIQNSGQKTHQLKFSKTGEQLAFFELRTSDAVGTGQIVLTAQSGNEKAVWSTEIKVRPSNPLITEVIEATISEGETWETQYTSLGIDGTNENILEISSFIPMKIDKWLTYLLNYPHGCSEQTISGAFPMLYAAQLTESNDQANKQADAKIKYAINRIQGLQLGSGGIAMWPGAQYPDDWTTSYAGHFLIEASQNGYVVSKQFLSKWKSYQQNRVKNWRHDRSVYNNDLMQAYRLYTLSLSGAAEIASMNRLAETSHLSPQAKWMLASAYAISGRSDAARRLIAKTTTNILNYSEYGYTYGSHIRDKAFILETYLRLGMNNNALNTLREIADELSTNNWLSTQTAAQSLRSVAMYLKLFPSGKQMNFTITKDNTSREYQTKNITHSAKLGTKNKDYISVANTGKGTLYVRIIKKGIPKEYETPASQNNLTMKVTYQALDGTMLNPDKITQGTIFYSNVTITHPGTLNNYSSVALTQIFPSGWEVMSDRFAFDDSGENSFTYQDIRDDRVITYFNLQKGRSINVRTRLSASFTGSFYMPLIYCEVMYNNRVNATIPGQWIQVTNPIDNITSDAIDRD